MTKEKSSVQIVKCQHQKEGKRCNNIICVREGDVVTVKRHGREVKACVTDFFPVIIVCERCGESTRIFL